MSFNKSLAEARKRAAEAEIDLIAPMEFILDKNKDLLENHQVLDNVPRPPCIYPWFHRYIDPKGRLRICANLPLSEEKLGDNYRLEDFENSPEEVRRRELLCKSPSQACFGLLCRESPLERPNDDVNYLE
jgi:MoaA/NifB/PqqE/SkfB family radical SAM enzyme